MIPGLSPGYLVIGRRPGETALVEHFQLPTAAKSRADSLCRTHEVHVFALVGIWRAADGVVWKEEGDVREVIRKVIDRQLEAIQNEEKKRV